MSRDDPSDQSSSSDRFAIGFVGLGNMGAPMVSNLHAADFTVWPWDADAGARERLAQQLGQPSPVSIGEVAAKSDVLVLMLPDGKIVNRVLFGVDDSPGLLDHLRDSTIVVDMGSSSPVDVVETARRLLNRGIALVDAPVSGGVPGARDATLTIMVGGDIAHVSRVRPMLDALGKQVLHVGPISSGQTAKCLNNLLSAAGMIAAAEVVAAGKRAGLDPEQFVEVLNTSSGSNDATRRKMSQYMLSGTFDSGFASRLMDKDLRHAAELLDSSGTAREHVRQVIRTWNEFTEKFPDSDHTAIPRHVAADLVPDGRSPG